ncbi:MAG: hypothetical protein HYT76_02200 [Deltaproteobacteria bacterium]|nr:hypothetical protein [Deltaproteobacteria bacterium]
MATLHGMSSSVAITALLAVFVGLPVLCSRRKEAESPEGQDCNNLWRHERKLARDPEMLRAYMERVNAELIKLNAGLSWKHDRGYKPGVPEFTEREVNLLDESKYPSKSWYLRYNFRLINETLCRARRVASLPPSP